MRWPKAIKSFNRNKIAPQLILCSLQTCQWLHNENFNSRFFWENEKSWNSVLFLLKTINTIGYIIVSGNAFACTELKLSLDKKCPSILRGFSFHLTGVAHQLTVERWWSGGCCCGCSCCGCGCCRCSCRCGRLWGFHKWSFFVNQSMISVKRKLSSIPGMQQSL